MENKPALYRLHRAFLFNTFIKHPLVDQSASTHSRTKVVGVAAIVMDWLKTPKILSGMYGSIQWSQHIRASFRKVEETRTVSAQERTADALWKPDTRIGLELDSSGDLTDQ
jgi:hypothetical protein